VDTDIQIYFASATVQHQTLLTILAVDELFVLVAFLLTLRAAFREMLASQAKPSPVKTEPSLG
jgi:hypothetical protein